MRPGLSLIAVAAASLVLVAAAEAGGSVSIIRFGVADDSGKYADDGGRQFFDQIAGIGLKTNRMMITWSPAEPLALEEQSFLDAAIAQANLAGVRVVLAVRPARAAAIGNSLVQARRFAAFLAVLAQRYPTVKTFVVGNEPNQPRFWQPQYRGSRAVAAADYEHTLALAYDALKGVDARITVIGGVLSSRGNDNAAASTNRSRSPVRFIRDLGAAYRASHRKRPIMDLLAFHPYPRSDRDLLTRGLDWPQAGFVNLNRVKQALWDAFHGTQQRTTETGLSIAIDEIGWQVSVPNAVGSLYTGLENVPVTSEANQAATYGDLIRRSSCDSSISDLYLQPFVDEVNLGGFQSGLLRADGSRRPSYDAVQSAIAQSAHCRGKQVAWRHASVVVGARALFARHPKLHWRRQKSWSFGLRAREDVLYKARIVRVRPRSLSSARIPRRAVLRAHGVAKANWTPRVHFPARRLKPGRYAYVAVLSAAMNPARKRTFMSRPFRVR